MLSAAGQFPVRNAADRLAFALLVVVLERCATKGRPKTVDRLDGAVEVTGASFYSMIHEEPIADRV